jgi:hypothetical protein
MALFEKLFVNELARTDGNFPFRQPNIPIGAVAYASLGTSAVHVAGTVYVSEINVPRSMLVTSIAVLNGTVVGTDSLIVMLYGPKGGMPLANSALAGVLSAGANALQEIPLTVPFNLTNDGRYYIGLQCNGATATTRRIAASTYLNLAKSFTGTFGTMAPLVLPTTTVADTGPIGYLV